MDQGENNSSMSDAIPSNASPVFHSPSLPSTFNGNDRVDHVVPYAIHRKIRRLSSTLKDTSKYLQNIDNIIYQQKNIDYEKNETILKLRSDLESTLQQLHLADSQIAPSPHQAEQMISNNVDASNQQILQQLSRDVMTIQDNYENLVSNLENRCETETDRREAELTEKFQESTKTYNEKKQKLQNVIKGWKKKCRDLEIELDRQKEYVTSLSLINDEILASKVQVEEKVESLMEKLDQRDSHRSQVEDLQSNVNFLVDKQSNVSKEIDELKETSQRDKSEKRKLIQETETLQNRLTLEKENYGKLLNKVEELESTRERLQQQNDDLQTTNANILASKTTREQDAKTKTKRIQQLEQSNKQLEDEKFQLDSEYQTLFKSLCNEIQILVEILAMDSRETFQAICSSYNHRDLRILIAESMTKLRWLQEEVRFCSVASSSTRTNFKSFNDRNLACPNCESQKLRDVQRSKKNVVRTTKHDIIADD